MKTKVIAQIWNSATREMESKRAIVLHWGIASQELTNQGGVGNYTVAYVMLLDGNDKGVIKEIFPLNMKVIV